MASSTLHLVWFKRDLRLSDHAPLYHAVQAAQAGSSDSVALIYLLEPELISQPDSAPQHFEFAMECLSEMASELPESAPIHLCLSDAPSFFQKLLDVLGNLIDLKVYSHEETGNWASFQRDLKVGKVLKASGAEWIEYPSNGVVRRLNNRDKWSKHWLERMEQPCLPRPSFEGIAARLQAEHKINQLLNALDFKQVQYLPGLDRGAVPWLMSSYWYGPPLADKMNRQRGGRSEALKHLQGFLQSRGEHYRKAMSSPLTAQEACSRISPYLAFGVFSMREVLAALATVPNRTGGWNASLKSFQSRLHWHCHFIQKLETEPELEFRAAHPALNKLRNAGPLNEEEQRKLQAWATGQTGFPMIDACMRMLRSTGWINFRMRAMLVAFASYQLWLDWRHTAPVLAREFLDYEPGIHYPQFQMQSGVTGINTLRIYNPVKQAHDQDPDGIFIKRWIPELKHCPTQWIANPWEMPPLIQSDVGCVIGQDYPSPIVNPDTAISKARERLSVARNSPEFQAIAQVVYQKHGSRNPNRNGTPRRKTSAAKDKVKKGLSDNDRQGSLF